MLAILLASCRGIVEYSYSTAYTYINQSSYDITIEVRDEFDESHTDMIAKGQSLTLSCYYIGVYPDVPFIFSSPRIFFVTISNGEVQIHNSYSGGNGPVGLFDNSLYKYIRTDDKKHTRYYEYTFTDDFFKGAYPTE